MKAWHLQLVLCSLLGLGACGKHTELEPSDASTPDGSALTSDNGGQVRVGDTRSPSSGAATGTADAAVAGEVANGAAGAQAGEAGRRGFPGIPRAGAGGGRSWGGFAGRPAQPRAGTGGFPRRPRDRDSEEEDAGVLDAGAAEGGAGGTGATDSGETGGEGDDAGIEP